MWLYTPEVFVFHAYKRVAGVISKYKYYAAYLHLYTYYVYIPAYWASAKRPHRSAPTKAQRNRCNSGAMCGPPLSFRVFEERLANTAAGSPLDFGAPAIAYIF